jgi:hypothetical protein
MPRMRLQQFAVLMLVDQRDQAIADLQAEHVDRGDVVPADISLLRGRRWRFDGHGGSRGASSAACAATASTPAAQGAADQEEDEVRHARDDAQQARRCRRSWNRTCGLPNSCPDHAADVLVACRRATPPCRLRSR